MKQQGSSNGLFIAIEGSDGSGKETQTRLLAERLKAKGYSVSVYDFPQYDKESSFHIREYLNGKYGSAEALGPYTPSLFFALDRFSAAADIKADLLKGNIVISNRYSGSNMAHQGAKFDTPEERQLFYQWLNQLEFGMLQIPEPDLNIALLVPVDTAQGLIDKKQTRSYTDLKRDIHEADKNHLSRAINVYMELANTFPDNFVSIDCTNEGELMSIPAINNLIWGRIEPMLKKIRKNKNVGKESMPKMNPYIKKNENGSYSITKEGQDYLKSAVTSVEGDVYAFTDKLSSNTIAAAMARLSRRSDDMRVTILDEFTDKEGKDEDLLRRVITAYGDDSVQQLSGTHLVVENASNILTKKLEWGRLASYLEQSTRYIFFDKQDEKGNYKYYTPTSLSKEHKRYYKNKMDILFAKYSEVVRMLTEYVRAKSSEPGESRDGAWMAATRAQACDAARGLLPVATTSTVGIFASGQALESLIMHLQSDEMGEARTTGDSILKEARKVTPTFLERADRPDRGGAWVAQRAATRLKMKKLTSEQRLQPIKGSGDTAVSLVDYWPKNEMDILPHLFYEHSTLSLQELRGEIAKWRYDDKLNAMKVYIGERLNRRHKPGRAFEVPHYSFDLVCDYGNFRDLQRHRMVDAIEWQELSPLYGYETPTLISEAGLEDLYDSCFELSMQLYQFLLENNYDLDAQYAVLLGHKMRWKVTMNAREAYHFIELRTSPQGHPGYRKLAKEMHQKIAEVHPLISEGMIFVNKDEDPELTRIASERATQYKLERLSKS